MRPQLGGILAWCLWCALGGGGPWWTAAARAASAPQDASSLRLVPFPKQVHQEAGTFAFDRPMILDVPADQVEIGRIVAEELKRAGLPAAEVRTHANGVRQLALLPANRRETPKPVPLDPPAREKYRLVIQRDGVSCTASDEAGLVYGAQTLRQLIRANRRDGAILCLTIEDWPSLRWRCFQDDMTRGPSSTRETLQFEAALGSYLKYNLMTYYMECQYAFKKHPKIGPKDGSLPPEDLAALVAYAKPLGVEILGNQQSFGHFGNILKHPEYAPLREVPDVLCPTNDASYRLLDEMYSEICPVVPFSFFNVCCDETWGLGTGPSRELVKTIGVGGVYVRHIRRVHDLLASKYQKRMMMWGDIILEHPEHLSQIPKDTIMLTWGYGDRPSFEDQITPFAKSGYEFFVCPGVSNWSRILPDFQVAQTNIQHFVRDGVKQGALGMLNTDWEDDGEAINAVKWHADAWAAECAWNGSKTSPSDFARRVGGVLFGESGERFAQAIGELAKTHRMAGMRGMQNSRFWEEDFPPQLSPAAAEAAAARLLAAVRPAIEHLQACRQQATANANLLDAYLFGARRMELIGQRMLDGLEAARLYAKAGDSCAPDSPKAATLEQLSQIETLVRKNRDAHEALGKQFAALWLSESKPYALEWTTARYARKVKGFDAMLAKLAAARKAVEAGRRLPTADDVGLVLPEAFARRARPRDVLPTPLEPSAAWAEPAATHRVGLIVRAGAADRFDLPVEVELTLPAELAAKPLRAFCSRAGVPPHEILAQLDPTDQPSKRRLALLIPGPLSKGAQAAIELYLGLPAPPAPLPQAVATRDAPGGMKWLENDKLRLLLGPEGGHVYRWEVKSLGNRDLTEPGERGWEGFCDLGGEHRSVTNRLACTARGPALVRYQCQEPGGLTKTISLYAGAPWIEVMLNETVGYYWDFDTPANFSADGPTPGTYLFANQRTGPVGRRADGVAAQVKAGGVHWGLKFNREKLALGLATPEVAAHHTVAPGSGAGGVGIESSAPASHFVTWAGVLDAEPAETMNRLSRTLDLRHQPEIVLYALQPASK